MSRLVEEVGNERGDCVGQTRLKYVVLKEGEPYMDNIQNY